MTEICVTPTKPLPCRAFRLDGLITPTLNVVRSNRIGHTKIFSPCYGRGKIFYSIVSTGNGFMFPTHWCKKRGSLVSIQIVVDFLVVVIS